MHNRLLKLKTWRHNHRQLRLISMTNIEGTLESAAPCVGPSLGKRRAGLWRGGGRGGVMAWAWVGLSRMKEWTPININRFQCKSSRVRQLCHHFPSPFCSGLMVEKVKITGIDCMPARNTVTSETKNTRNFCSCKNTDYPTQRRTQMTCLELTSAPALVM
jgi:hypothetical protein